LKLTRRRDFSLLNAVDRQEVIKNVITQRSTSGKTINIGGEEMDATINTTNACFISGSSKVIVRARGCISVLQIALALQVQAQS
jgi:DNA-binding protein